MRHACVRFAWSAVLAGVMAAPGSAAAGGKPPHDPVDPYSQIAAIPGATAVGNEQCLSCHAAVEPVFTRTAHGSSGVACESCHGAGSLHVNDAAHGHIHDFTKEPAADANGACLRCHAEETPLQNWKHGRHKRAGVRCTECHSVHATASEGNRRLTESRNCLRCHPEQEAQGGLPYHHPVREGRMGCADCHDPHGGANGSLRASQANQLCFGCHAEYRGPFTYQHPPVVEDCLKCHAPHGSMNAHLLQVSEPMLCLQCHPAHHNGSGIPLLNACTNCHSAIHGTDTPSATGGSVFIDK